MPEQIPQPDPREQFKQLILTTALDRLRQSLSGTKIFAGALHEDFRVHGNLLMVKGSQFFRFIARIEEIQTEQGPLIQPRIENLDIPEEHRREGWARKIVQIWEQTFIEAGFRGKFYLSNVQKDAQPFWLKMGYTDLGFPEGWCKQVPQVLQYPDLKPRDGLSITFLSKEEGERQIYESCMDLNNHEEGA